MSTTQKVTILRAATVLLLLASTLLLVSQVAVATENQEPKLAAANTRAYAESTDRSTVLSGGTTNSCTMSAIGSAGCLDENADGQADDQQGLASAQHPVTGHRVPEQFLVPPGYAQLERDPANIVALPVIAAPNTFLVSDEVGLRAAIEAANVAEQMLQIELVANIVLTSPLPDIHNPGNDTLLIDGNDHVLDANEVGRALSILDSTAVAIEDMTITGGNAGEGCGGGLFVNGQLTVRRSKVINNVAGSGGGICVISDQNPAMLTLEQVLVSDNEAQFAGGGIYALGNPTPPADDLDVILSVLGSRLEANQAGSGGGLYAATDSTARVDVNVVDSMVSVNFANSKGGGVRSVSHEGFIRVRILRSTIANNSSARGAGFHNEGSFGYCWNCGGRAAASFINSTLSGNTSRVAGGAIANYNYLPPWPRHAGPRTAPLSPDEPPPIGGPIVGLSYCTVTGNAANEGSGILNEGDSGYADLYGTTEGVIQLLATLIADNVGDGTDCSGPVYSRGYNLDSDGSCQLTKATDQSQGSARLIPLALNAPGTTMTHALSPNSDARDWIPQDELGCRPYVPDTDQRGVPRPQPTGEFCDIGAFEADVP